MYPPTVLPQKCWFCNFHAVFGHIAQIVTPQVDPIWETLNSVSVFEYLMANYMQLSYARTVSKFPSNFEYNS